MSVFVGALSDRLHVPISVRPNFASFQKQGPGADLIEGAALVDTGAEVSMISRKCADDLGLVSKKVEPIIGISGNEEDRHIYCVSFKLVCNRLPQDIDLGHAIHVYEDISTRRKVPIDGRDFDTIALIGMDILRHCQFYIDGLDKRFVLTAPAPITSAGVP